MRCMYKVKIRGGSRELSAISATLVAIASLSYVGYNYYSYVYKAGIKAATVCAGEAITELLSLL